jgi:hypothetical protein
MGALGENAALLALITLLTCSFLCIVYTQDYIYKQGLSVNLLSFLTPLSGFLVGLLRAPSFAPPLAPKRAHVFLGLLIWGSAAMSASAQRQLSLPIALALKSTKIIPTMLIAALWLRKRFKALDWGAALLCAVGIMLCLEHTLGGAEGGGGGEPATAAGGVGSHWLGVLEMGVALLFDGGSANAQEAIMRQYSSPPQELALFSYGAAAAAALVAGMVQSGSQGLAAGAASVAGQWELRAACAGFVAGCCGATWCSLELISGFGASSFMLLSALAKALVTTICIATGKGSVPAQQILGIALVFSATVLSSLAKGFAEQQQAEEAAVPAIEAGGGGSAGSGRGLLLKPSAAATQQGGMGGATAGHMGITPRTAALEGGLLAGAAVGLAGGAPGLRRRGMASSSSLSSFSSSSSSSADAAAAPAAAPGRAVSSMSSPRRTSGTAAAGGGGGGSSGESRPLRSTLSSALSLVSAAALGIERPKPSAEALSPLALRASPTPSSSSSPTASSPSALPRLAFASGQGGRRNDA